MPDKKPWTADEIPDLSGKTIVVTGANSGIGLEAAREFARKHADVILACRDLGKARTAAADITASAPGAKVDVMELDLSNLASVRGFSDAFHLQRQTLHVLCNNAGVMAIPYRQTADGFEMQFGTNHLGHFALTGLLLDRLLATEGARVVNVASGAHRMGSIRFEDLQWKNGYRESARLRAEQAGQFAVHVGDAAQSRRGGREIVVRRMPSRICRDQSASGRTEDVWIVDDGIANRVRQPAVRTELPRWARCRPSMLPSHPMSTAAITTAPTAWPRCGEIRRRSAAAPRLGTTQRRPGCGRFPSG